jgi:hypothetical protein
MLIFGKSRARGGRAVLMMKTKGISVEQIFLVLKRAKERAGGRADSESGHQRAIVLLVFRVFDMGVFQ